MGPVYGFDCKWEGDEIALVEDGGDHRLFK